MRLINPYDWAAEIISRLERSSENVAKSDIDEAIKIILSGTEPQPWKDQVIHELKEYRKEKCECQYLDYGPSK